MGGAAIKVKRNERVSKEADDEFHAQLIVQENY